jgi:hypothetical protein
MKKQPFNLTVKDMRLLEKVLKAYPAPPNLHHDIVELYDRLTTFLYK